MPRCQSTPSRKPAINHASACAHKLATVLTAIVLALGSIAQAEETWVPLALPAFEGYKVELQVPVTQDAEYDRVVRGDLLTMDGAPPSMTATRYLSMGAGYEDFPFTLTVEVAEDPVTLASWADLYQAHPEAFVVQIHEAGYGEQMGVETFYAIESPNDSTVKDPDDKKIRARRYAAIFDERVLLQLRYRVSSVAGRISRGERQAAEAALDKMAASVRVQFEEAYESTSPTYAVASERIAIAVLPQLNFTAQVAMDIPQDWVAEESVLQPAISTATPGRIEMIVEPYSGNDSGDTKLVVVVEGMDEQPPRRSDFEKRGQELVESLLDNPRRRATRTLDEPMKDFLFGEHCLSAYAHRDFHNSKGVKVSEYTGTDQQGQPSRALLYNAGGHKMACSYAYVGPESSFDQFREQAEAVVRSISVEFMGPPLER